MLVLKIDGLELPHETINPIINALEVLELPTMRLKVSIQKREARVGF